MLSRATSAARCSTSTTVAASPRVTVVCLSTQAVAAAASPAERMTHSEAFVETLAAHGVTDMFGIVGSAFMDALDLFPAAGIRFVSVQHEQNAAHMADGYQRASGRTGVCIAQNGPGITNFVTGVAAAYWNHSPTVIITPEAGTATIGLGGFQECDQLPIFSTITKAQVHVNNAARMAELTGVAFDAARRENGPVQLNIPRDYFYGDATVSIPQPTAHNKVAGDTNALAAAADLLRSASRPVILAGNGVVTAENGVESLHKLATELGAPVATTYLHNDAYPASEKLWCGPLGYCGHKTAMHTLSSADVVLALGTRLGPFGTLPQYGMEYWPQGAKVIQVDINAERLGRVRPADVSICGDAALAANDLHNRLFGESGASAPACVATKDQRISELESVRSEWEAELNDMAYANEAAARAEPGRIVPRQALRALEEAMPSNAIVSTDIGNTCSVANTYLRFNQPRSFLAAGTFGNCGYAFPAAMGAKMAAPERPCVAYVGDGAWGMSLNETLTCIRENIPTTAVVFNNRQWGAEKKNQVLWFGDRYIGSNLEHPETGFAGIAEAMGAKGIQVSDVADVGPALQQAIDGQMNRGETTVVEILTTRELGDPFRRDAMKLPQRLLAKYAHTNRDTESDTGQPTDIAALGRA